ncbi:DUF4394 domain-containing protein [Micromonospora sp. LAH09]|uniref:DUF4394 domain-containing protein n=1 Tax=Micromonospora cabrerizensis TaxID=2911213 RepID=UPI001EE9646A|nr:DUF4394 domain-containing protein [Micromonospora cabrerizensis]MCG5471789.1 DUF4394 domain-containing protein [Micromonospora cabrerizensis]
MHRVFHRGLLLTSTAIVIGMLTTSAGAAARPHSAPPVSTAASSRSSLDAFPCTILWDLLNAGGRNGRVAVGLTEDQQLLKFAANRPGLACLIGTVDLPGTENLVGIDYRVQDGRLYGVGSSGGIFTLSTSNATATKVSQLTVALSGSFFGVDFNPAADRLRIISNLGQNLRHNVNVGGTTLADSTLTYPPAVTAAPGLTAAAYTNNDLDPSTATTLFDVDTNLDQVALQSPANSGQLVATGSLGVAADQRAGFDIHSTVRSGRATGNNAYAVLNGSVPSRVYQVDLLTGAAQSTGGFAVGHLVIDLAVQLNQQ